jgi:hypothetical protein
VPAVAVGGQEAAVLYEEKNKFTKNKTKKQHTFHITVSGNV